MTQNAHLSLSVPCPPLTALCCCSSSSFLSLCPSPLCLTYQTLPIPITVLALSWSKCLFFSLVLFLSPPRLLIVFFTYPCLLLPLPTVFYFISLHFISCLRQYSQTWTQSSMWDILLNDIMALCYLQLIHSSMLSVQHGFLLPLPLWMWQIYSWKCPHLDSE